MELKFSTKWNDYEKQIGSPLYVTDGKYIAVISEGNGSNLSADDIKNGYVDYWIVDVYNMGTRKAADGGQWMEKKLIAEIDYSLGDVIERVDFGLAGTVILDPHKGEDIIEAIESNAAFEIPVVEEQEAVYKRTADACDKLECDDFALWYMLRGYRDELKEKLSTYKLSRFEIAGMKETLRGVETAIEELAERLW